MNENILLEDRTQKEILVLLRSLMRRTIDKFHDVNFWNPRQLLVERPFHTALVKPEFWKGSKFERSFTTSLGQTVYEKIAFCVSNQFFDEVILQRKTEKSISTGELAKISQILNELEHTTQLNERRYPNWSAEVEEILKSRSSTLETLVIISDLYLKKNNKEIFIEIKSSKPNADQTKVSKEKLLKLQAMFDGEIDTFFALTDNPYTTRANYNWPHPKRYFDMVNSPAVLIGKDFWDFIGYEGLFEDLISLFKLVGQEFSKEIEILFTS